MITIYVPAVRARQSHHRVMFEGGAEVVKIDWSAWADDNGAVTAATWTVDSGNAAISGEAIASSVASALITTSSAGASLIKVVGTSGTDLDVQFLEILTKDLHLGSDDYGLVSGHYV